MSVRVLLVDDERLVLSSLRRLLKRAGFVVHTAPSGADALALLEREAVDVIVSDYKMPGMTGLEFLAQAAPRWPDVRRCVLTAQADKELLARAVEDGLVEVAMTKPWDNTGLVEVLRGLTAGA